MRPRAYMLIVLMGLALACGPTPLASAAPAKDQAAALRTQISQLRAQTWAWQDVTMSKRSPTAYMEQRVRGLGYLRWMHRLWLERRAQARYLAHNPPHLRFWLCVHGGEANWDDNASNNPHYGGLQMGHWFMHTYGPHLLRTKGTANNWTVPEQLWVAERAYQKEGYSLDWLLQQWHDTAPPCLHLLGAR